MLYFIPAWYQQNKWRELEQNWHSRRMHTEFDDTVKQVQLFHRSGKVAYKILLLSYAPNFRHFLHRQGVYHAPYWSCFDAIQEITAKKAAVLSFHNLKWPEEIEFVYTPFAVLAYQNDVLYSKIEFGENGNPIEVTLYRYNEAVRRNVYDDRGFLSSTEIYDNGELRYTDYLTPDGHVKFREYSPTGYIEINQDYNYYLIFNGSEYEKKKFKKPYYDGIVDLLVEVFRSYIYYCDYDSKFCIAMHEYNARVLEKVLKSKYYILSFFGDRFRMKEHENAKKLVEAANYVVTDSEATSRYLNRDMGYELPHIMDISPFDSRVDFGISQQLKVQNILVPVDELPEDRFEQVIYQLAKYITTNDMVCVHIFTREAAYNVPRDLLKKITDILIKYDFDPRWTIPQEDQKSKDETDIDNNKDVVPTYFVVEQCVDELSVSKCIREQRILLDMSHNPNLYLQINCISSGIPQLVRRRTQYVEHKQNGLIFKDFNKIPESLDYFLNGFSNWNKAKVFSYQIGQKYTSRKLLTNWEYVLNVLEDDYKDAEQDYLNYANEEWDFKAAEREYLKK